MNGRITARGRSAAAIASCLAAVSCGEATTAIEPPDPLPGPTPDLVALDALDADYQGLPGGLVANGVPDVTPSDGRIVIIAISMSNGRLEFQKYMDLYAGHADVSPAIGLVNCAQGGNALERWLELDILWDGCRQRIADAGFDLDQVRVVWAKNANQFTQHGLTLPDPGADYYDLVENIGALSERIGREFPSVRAIFHTSRIYAGWAQAQASRGEPMSYEGGFAVNVAIERWQAGELPDAPWIGWGPYLWANATTPNSHGVFWTPEDFQDGGTNHHPSDLGQAKVADALHAFFMGFDWYRR